MSFFSRIYNVTRSKVNSFRQKSESFNQFDDLLESETETFSDTSQPGIDPEIAQCYANLEIPNGSDLETVKHAWKRQVRKYHPDLHSNDADKQRIATELVKGLNHAYEQLKNHLENN